jgi:hypothetical protein
VVSAADVDVAVIAMSAALAAKVATVAALVVVRVVVAAPEGPPAVANREA